MGFLNKCIILVDNYKRFVWQFEVVIFYNLPNYPIINLLAKSSLFCILKIESVFCFNYANLF